MDKMQRLLDLEECCLESVRNTYIFGSSDVWKKNTYMLNQTGNAIVEDNDDCQGPGLWYWGGIK